MEKSLIVDKFDKNHKFIKTRTIPNGHDCWGNYEYYDEYYVSIKEGNSFKNEHVFEKMFIIHNNREVIATAFDFNLDRILKELNEL